MKPRDSGTSCARRDKIISASFSSHSSSASTTKKRGFSPPTADCRGLADQTTELWNGITFYHLWICFESSVNPLIDSGIMITGVICARSEKCFAVFLLSVSLENRKLPSSRPWPHALPLSSLRPTFQCQQHDRKCRSICQHLLSSNFVLHTKCP